MATKSTQPRIRLNLRPGEKGTKKLVDKYGSRLISVRYRYDEARGKRYKTVELIEEEMPWAPAKPAARARPPEPSHRFGIWVGYEETQLRERVKQAGGIWRPRQKCWELTYAQIVALELEARIKAEAATG